MPVRFPFCPPMTIDGIPFIFETQEVIDLGDKSKRFEYKVMFPSGVAFHHSRGAVSPKWTYSSQVVANYDRHPALWTTSHLWNGQRYEFEHLTTLEVALKWLYMHQTYVAVRQMAELDCFDHSIQRLIEAGNTLCSANMYRELCGFIPSSEKKWKIYVETHPTMKGGQYLAPLDHYELTFQGEWLEASRRYESTSEESRRCVLLLDPHNHLATSDYFSYQPDRTGSNWVSMFGAGDEYWQLTPWEKVTVDCKTEESRLAMERYYKTLMVESFHNRKPN